MILFVIKNLSKYIQIIIDQSNKLNQHIEQILSLAKTDSHQIKLQKTKLNLYKNLELVKENILLKHDKDISFSIDDSCSLSILADAFHFYNLLYNLADNAVKYSDFEPQLECKISKKDNAYIFQMNDNGPGIPEKDLPFIFDKFYRVSRKDNEEIEGFGIGLAYVKKICELHHWKITVKNSTNGLLTEIIIPKKDIENA